MSAHLGKDLARRPAELLKWMLGFRVLSLVTYVGALIGFATVLR